MATLPNFLSRTGLPRAAAAFGGGPRHSRAAIRDDYSLRPLPGEDLYLYTKKIDNSRLVREPDPQSRGACWSAIGAATVGLVLLTGVLAPSVANIMAGYKLEALRKEERVLLDERRTLDLEEARLTAPQRLEQLAARQNLVAPKAGQVVRLNNKSDSAVAMIH